MDYNNATESDDEKEEKKKKDTDKKKPTKFQKQGIDFIDSWQWGVFMAVLTLYTLFADDLRVLFIPKKYDDLFFFITTVALLIFSGEILLACYCKPDYFPNFFFWLDVMSTVSMIFDIGWFMDNFNTVFTGTGDATSIAKTSRAARVTRIVRLVRLIRLVRIVKLYKQAQMAA